MSIMHMDRYIGNEELSLLKEVIDSQKLWKGEGTFVRRFEEAFAGHLGIKHTIAVNSGTSALEVCVAACNISAGDEVICTPYSFIASSTVVFRFNGIPVFADVDPRTLCLDPDSIAARISDRTKAIIVVHIYGQPAQMDRIMEIAAKHNLYVIEDCCQAYDACYGGKKVGTIGDIAAFSLQQNKHITSGEGGVVTTQNEELFKRAAMYSNTGMIWDWEPPEEGLHFTIGGNYRMGELQGAVALAQLEKLDGFNSRRRELVQIIEEGLSNVNGVELAHVYEGAEPNYYFYPLRFNEAKAGLSRQNLLERCAKKLGDGIEVHAGTIRINYFEPVYRNIAAQNVCLAKCVRHDRTISYGPGLCPKLEAVIPDHYINLRIHHRRSCEEMRMVIKAIRDVLQENTA